MTCLEYDFERSESPGELLQWLPNMLRRFTRVEHLGIFFEPGFDVPSPVVLPLIAEGTTSHLKIKTFETTILPSGMGYYGLDREIFPFLESITFGKERIQNYLHEKGKKYDCIPSPFRGNRLTPSTISEIMSLESQCDLKINLKTTHIFIRPDDQHAELSQSWETLVSPDILSWAKFHDILIIPECCTGDLSCFRTSGSQIFLDLTDVEYNPGTEQIESFLTEIGPSTQSLILSTYWPMPTNEEYSRDDILIQCESERRTRIIRDFLTVVVNRIPEFRLEDIQNFPRLDNDDRDPFEDMVKLSAECFEPLSRLPSLTSIDLDFSTLGMKPSR